MTKRIKIEDISKPSEKLTELRKEDFKPLPPPFDTPESTPDFAPHGGESPRGATTRFAGALESIAAQHVGERVIVVAHGGVLSLGLAQVLHGDYTRFERSMDNCAVSELAMDRPAELLSFNYTDHLADA